MNKRGKCILSAGVVLLSASVLAACGMVNLQALQRQLTTMSTILNQFHLIILR